MKNEPWVRFGILMSPKISEKPADSRNSRPPSVMLLTASSSHRLTLGGLRSAFHRRGDAPIHPPLPAPPPLLHPPPRPIGKGVYRGGGVAGAPPRAPPRR